MRCDSIPAPRLLTRGRAGKWSRFLHHRAPAIIALLGGWVGGIHASDAHVGLLFGEHGQECGPRGR